MKILSYFSIILLGIFGLNIFVGISEKIDVPSNIFRTFSKFCWNKLYILGCFYIVY